MDSIAAISQRIAHIQTTIASLSPPVGRSVSAVAASSFATQLEAAAAEFTPPAANGLNADGVPTELAAYGNGNIPREALTPLGQSGHRLWAPAAAAFENLRSAAAASGVKIGITDSYRSYDAQVDVARRKGLYSEGGLAAKPGTSRHGWGMAVDLDLDANAQAWMGANAARFGFTVDPREPWHWNYLATSA